jgi:type VI secretion system protein
MPMARARGFRYLVVLSFLLGPAACGPKKARVPVVGSRKTERFTIQVNVSDSANQNSPLPVDFVVVMDKKLAPEVAKLSAKDWFDRRVQIQRDFATKVKVASWEWVPGQHVGPIAIAIPANARSGFLFANYQNSGEHRGFVDVRAPVVANFGPEDFSLQALK